MGHFLGTAAFRTVTDSNRSARAWSSVCQFDIFLAVQDRPVGLPHHLAGDGTGGHCSADIECRAAQAS